MDIASAWRWVTRKLSNHVNRPSFSRQTIYRSALNETDKMYVATPIFFIVMGAAGPVSLSTVAQIRRSPPSPPGHIMTAATSILVLNAAEYITSGTGFKVALNLLKPPNDKIMGSQGVLLLALDPGASKPERFALLRSEATAVHDDGDGECAPPAGRSGAPAGAG